MWGHTRLGKWRNQNVRNLSHGKKRETIIYEDKKISNRDPVGGKIIVEASIYAFSVDLDLAHLVGWTLRCYVASWMTCMVVYRVVCIIMQLIMNVRTVRHKETSKEI